MKKFKPRAVDAVRIAAGRGQMGQVRWHPTWAEIEDADEGDCCCEWCMNEVNWEIIAQEMDKTYLLTTKVFDLEERYRYG